MNQVKLWAGLAAVVLASHSMDATAQATQFQSITLSNGTVEAMPVDSTTNMLWYAFRSYKDGLAQGFRMATVDDLKAYNQMNTSLTRRIHGMEEQSTATPSYNRVYMDRTEKAYVMDGETLSVLTITESGLYWCDRLKLTEADCIDTPTIHGSLNPASYEYFGGSLDAPGSYWGNLAPIEAFITAAMVRDVSAVPEPESAGLALIGLLALGGLAIRRRAAH